MSEMARFTIDGSNALEKQLCDICNAAADGVSALIGKDRFEGLVLGGGYGRGEGGVLHNCDHDALYNDLEFYLFLRGPCRLNEIKYSHCLQELSQELARKAGVHVEFKILSRRKLERSPVTMGYYDLVAGHQILAGDESLFENCVRHLNAEKIPLSEAARLLMNRCAGLLFARARLNSRTFSDEDADFVGRNHAKAQLAFGDVLLTALGQYHFSCCERHRRLQALTAGRGWPWLEEARLHHKIGVEFKLHPQRRRGTVACFAQEHSMLSDFALRIWLWLESLRLGVKFASATDYASSDVNKCPETSSMRNLLVNTLQFGIAPGNPARYPRERLLNGVALLLWEPSALADPVLLRRLQRQLNCPETEFSPFVGAYERLWHRFN